MLIGMIIKHSKICNSSLRTLGQYQQIYRLSHCLPRYSELNPQTPLSTCSLVNRRGDVKPHVKYFDGIQTLRCLTRFCGLPDKINCSSTRSFATTPSDEDESENRDKDSPNPDGPALPKVLDLAPDKHLKV